MMRRFAVGGGLYFRIIVTGLLVALSLAVLLYIPMKWEIASIWEYPIPKPEDAHILIFPMALLLWLLAKGVFLILEKYNPDRKYKLELANLNELSQIVYENQDNMIMVTMENDKIYAGWPV